MFETRGIDQPFANSVSWAINTILGEVAIAICIFAVAFIGFTMLTGRLPIRRGGQVILGCFLLLGAPAIAASLMSFATTDRTLAPRPTIV